MKTVRCIGRHFSNGRIVGYRLVDSNGVIRDVQADRLKDAIADGEALVLNLYLTSDGRLRVKSESNTDIHDNIFKSDDSQEKNTGDPSENRESSRVGKVISFAREQELRSKAYILKMMLDAYNSVPNAKPFRIMECEFGKYRDQTFATVILHNRSTRSVKNIITKRESVEKDYEELTFMISKFDNREEFFIDTPCGEFEADTLQDALDKFKDDLRIICFEYADTLKQINEGYLEALNEYNKLMKVFNTNDKDYYIIVAGNNIVYLASKVDTLTVEVPRFATVVAEGAFEYCYNLKVIKSPVHLFRQICKMIDSRKIRVDRVGNNI